MIEILVGLFVTTTIIALLYLTGIVHARFLEKEWHFDLTCLLLGFIDWLCACLFVVFLCLVFAVGSFLIKVINGKI